MAVHYTAKQVRFLRGLTHGQAIELTTSWLDSCQRISSDGHYSPGSSEGDDIPLIALWREVHDAFEAVLASSSARAAATRWLEEQISGKTERELAAAAGLSQPTMHRRMAGVLDSVLLLLNGNYRVVHPSSS